jgi:hypothetical protein
MHTLMPCRFYYATITVSENVPGSYLGDILRNYTVSARMDGGKLREL